MEEDEVSVPSEGREKVSGWEVADNLAGQAGRAAEAAAHGLVKVYGVGLVIVAVAAIVVLPSSWWLALLVAIYGVYLVLPGNKWVVW